MTSKKKLNATTFSLHISTDYENLHHQSLTEISFKGEQ